MNRSHDSDASADNRPSTTFHGGSSSHLPPNILDAAYKQSALRCVNTYLSACNFSSSLSLKPLPSARDISETLKFVLCRLEFQSSKLEDDLPTLLKFLNCPHKINRSALKAPGTPHAFPYILSVIHWLVQVAESKDELSYERHDGSPESDFDALTAYTLRCYSHFMEGEDDAADEVKSKFLLKIEREKDVLKENVLGLDSDIVELEAKLACLRSSPSKLEALEAVKRDLEKDVVKFEDFIAKLTDGMELMHKAVNERERELAETMDEKERIIKESEDLKRKVQEQDIDLWAADRMKRELQAVDREIKEVESARSEWEDKLWSLDQKIHQQFKALEALTFKNNQALRRLKLGNDLQYRLNPEGCTVEEVIGVDYKATIKPAINSFSNEIKRSSKQKSEEFLALQMQNVQLNNKTEEKKSQIAVLEQSIEEMEDAFNSMDKEIQAKESRSKFEAENMLKKFQTEDQNLEAQLREAKETLKAAELNLQETEKQNKVETEKCAYELFAVIDAVSKHKEYMESKLNEMGKELSETSDSVPKVFKLNFSPKSSSFTRSPLRQMPDNEGR